MKNALKTRVITFRISEEVWQAAHERALLAGKNVSEWARDEIVERLDETHGMSPAERMMFVEVNSLRELVEILVVSEASEATGERQRMYLETLEKSIDNREAAAREYFAQLAEAGGAKGR
ncbi:MAG: hypothetical protein MSG64_18910 [Pyrinomonadaceae bacterium MAG19_C2-C3]|nr:hypothetical protein [Pyrinomonadaceae bacterium MAG19_C2-C3]